MTASIYEVPEWVITARQSRYIGVVPSSALSACFLLLAPDYFFPHRPAIPLQGSVTFQVASLFPKS
jgi:hypothetical protein